MEQNSEGWVCVPREKQRMGVLAQRGVGSVNHMTDNYPAPRVRAGERARCYRETETHSCLLWVLIIIPLINGMFINGIFPAISVNKGCHSRQRLQPSNVSQWALRKLRAEKNTRHLAAVRLQPLPAVSAEETQGVKTQDTGPRWLRCISKEWFQWAQTLASSPAQKSTKCLNLR